MEPEQVKYRARVRTPDGLTGYIDAKIFGTDRFLVTMSRAEYKPEDWQQLSPLNGPTVSKEYPLCELTLLLDKAPILNGAKYHHATWGEIVQGAETSMKKRPSSLTRGAGDANRIAVEVKVGSRWATKKGGYVYKVTSVIGDQVDLSWVDGRDIRHTTVDNLIARYTIKELSDIPDEPKIEEKPKPVRMSGEDRREEAPTKALPTLSVGEMWATRRNGDTYTVLSVNEVDGTATLLWTGDGKYKRKVNLSSLESHYVKVTPEES